MSAPPVRASAQERERVVADTIRLCEIESPSRREGAVAAALTAELRELGLEAAEDGSAAATGSQSGNLLSRVPGPEGAPTILLCAHMDTVPLAAPVEVVRHNGVLTNANEAILGADNKAAVAVLLAVARRAAGGGLPVGLELLFTTCEELALLGAKELTAELRSDFGFVFDHASPIGELVAAAPTYYAVSARFHGAAAHAGLRPEDGRNAIVAAARALAEMPIGRLDEATTANAGTISGGSAANVVAERCELGLECRSLDDGRAAGVARAMVDACAAAASDAECDVETEVQELFRAYRMPRSAAPMVAACAALEALGIAPVPRPTGGGSDANVFNARGLAVLNVANATERNHQPDEAVSTAALETTLDVALGILEAAAQ